MNIAPDISETEAYLAAMGRVLYDQVTEAAERVYPEDPSVVQSHTDWDGRRFSDEVTFKGLNFPDGIQQVEISSRQRQQPNEYYSINALRWQSAAGSVRLTMYKTPDGYVETIFTSDTNPDINDEANVLNHPLGKPMALRYAADLFEALQETKSLRPRVSVGLVAQAAASRLLSGVGIRIV